MPELPHITDEMTTPTPPVDKPGITSSGNPLGKAIHRVVVEAYEELPLKEQHEVLRSTWRSVAMGLATRAKSFSTSCSSKEFGKLQQLVSAGATALEKAFPVRENTQSPKLIVNLFNSLGQRATRIAIPVTPTIDAVPKEDPK